MEKNNNLVALKIFIVLSFVVMLALNTLANVLPINGVTTGKVSDTYPNQFAPAPLTFLIWFVIYVLLLFFVLYSLGVFKGSDTSLLKKIGPLFVVSSFLNAAWIVSWNYFVIWLSMILMAGIFVTLAIIYVRIGKTELSTKEKWLVRLPFSIYFGWITIAAVANAVTLLVSLKWDGFGIDPSIWMIAITIIAALIGILTIIINRDAAYGLVFVWAFVGILLQHLGVFTGVTVTVIAALALLAAATIAAAVWKKKAV